jgi:hypothetical protein
MTMSESKIRRKSKAFGFTLSTATSVADTLPMFDMAGGMIEVGTMSTSSTQINIWASDTSNGPFFQLYDKDGAVVKVTLSASTTDGRAYALPDEVFAAQFIKLLSATTNSTGTIGTAVFKG